MPYKNNTKQTALATKTQLSKKRLTIFLLSLVLVGAAAVLLINHNRKLVVHTTASQNTKGEATTSGNPATSPPESGNTSSSTSNTTDQGDAKSNSTTGGATTATLVAPTGEFVSAHTVPMNATISSVCNTTTGASCYIKFTADSGVSKQTETQVTDRGGSAYWNQSPKALGLTPGDWKVSATATLNGRSLSSDDAKVLTVTQ